MGNLKTIILAALVVIIILATAILTQDKGEACLRLYDDSQYIELVKNNILGMDSVDVFVVEVPEASTLSQKNLRWSMYVTAGPRKNEYLIFDVAKEKDQKKRKEILCHELIHVAQLQSRNVINIGDGGVIYHGSYYNVSALPYEKWPWEIEAYDLQWSIYELSKKMCQDENSFAKVLIYGRGKGN